MQVMFQLPKNIRGNIARVRPSAAEAGISTRINARVYERLWAWMPRKSGHNASATIRNHLHRTLSMTKRKRLPQNVRDRMLGLQSKYIQRIRTTEANKTAYSKVSSFVFQNTWVGLNQNPHNHILVEVKNKLNRSI